MIILNKPTRWVLIILIVVLAVILAACDNTTIAGDEKSGGEAGGNQEYIDFVKNIHKINDEKFTNFISISRPGTNNVFMTMPQSDLDDREKDYLSDGSPSKYIFEFINKKEDVYIRVTFMYYSMNNEGILLQSIIAPGTQLERKGNYNNLDFDFPTSSSNLISINNYTILIESTLSASVDKGSSDKDMEYLLVEESKFINEIQSFLLNTKRN